MNNNSKEELKGNEFNRLLLVPCEEKLLIGECAASAEYKCELCKKVPIYSCNSLRTAYPFRTCI